VFGRLLHRAIDRGGLYARRRQHLPRGVDWLLDVQRLLGAGGSISAIDVGANVGQTSRAIVDRFPGATVHAIEPVGSTFHALRAAVRQLPGVNCHQVAFSDREGKQVIRAVPRSVFNSLSSPLWDNAAEAVPEEIELTTLDRFLARVGLNRVDLLNIDAEGHDLAVLRGANAALARGAVRCVYVEVTFSPKNTQNSLFDPIAELLQAAHYRFMGLYEMDFFQLNPWDESFCNALFWLPRA
jgi:FkbM family methyltransferase